MVEIGTVLIVAGVVWGGVILMAGGASILDGHPIDREWKIWLGLGLAAIATGAVMMWMGRLR
jgi:hypothetical protein